MTEWYMGMQGMNVDQAYLQMASMADPGGGGLDPTLFHKI